MRIPPPPSLRLDRDELLRDVRARLLAHLPDWAARQPDGGDPAWLLLEQAAWMVETLSRRLDDYPLAVLQQFFHLTGASLEPARPALGAVVLEPREAGVLDAPPDTPAPWRFFSTQNEARGSLEFVPAELAVPVRPGAVVGWWSLVGGVVAERGDGVARSGAAAYVLGPAAARRCAWFDQEVVELRVRTAGAVEVERRLAEVVERLAERRLGWLQASLEQRTPGEVVLVARVRPAGAFARQAPQGLAPGGDLEGDWNLLDDSTWTPPVRVAPQAPVATSLRGLPPPPGPVDGTLLLPELRRNVPVDQLLERIAAPMPENAVRALWSTLVGADTSLRPLEPRIERVRAGGAPAWATAALAAGVWPELASRRSAQVCELQWSPTPGRVRFAVHTGGPGLAPLPVVWLLSGPPEAPHLREADPPFPVWSLPVPCPEGRDLLTAYELPTDQDTHGALLLFAEEPRAVLLNPLLVLNAPVVPDNREVVLQRAVPEPVDLIHPDLVGPASLERLAEEALPPSVTDRLRALPLATFQVVGQPPITGYRGIALDASAGRVTLNAPDHAGVLREFQPRDRLTLDWYRRTDGAAGNLEPGALRFVQQGAGVRPALRDAWNPVPTAFGRDREDEATARLRVFAQAQGVPVTPADWENLARVALGPLTGEPPLVRCWSYAERTLRTTRLWAEVAGEESPRAALEAAGPAVLVFAVAAKGELLARAREALSAMVRRQSRRGGTVRDALVVRLYPLRLRGRLVAPLPWFELGDASGDVLDEDDRRQTLPVAGVWLDAAIVELA